MKTEILLESINDIKNEYDNERKKNRFNVFTALFKENDEVKLHSRFISYLLSSNSGHGMEDLFLKIFVRDILKIKEIEFDINSCEVIPNEFLKKKKMKLIF